MKKYVTYLRVSTTKQGDSGLGLEAQKKMCKDFIANTKGEQAATFQDIESGTHRERKGLWQAIDFCKKHDCALVIAKLDRLARDVEFTFRVINTGVEIHFCDMPMVNTMILGVFASVAQYERELISERTTKALAEKKRQGAKLGAQNEKWQETYNNKTDEQKKAIGQKRGNTRNGRYMAKQETQIFLRILRRVFGFESENPKEWNWSIINTKATNRDAIRGMMKDYHEINGCFAKWSFDEADDIAFQRRLSCHLVNVKKAVFYGE